MEPGSTARLRVTVIGDRGRAVRAPGLAAWLARIAPPRARGEVVIAIVSDARIRLLNRKFRRRDQVTDVLSFPGAAGQARLASQMSTSAPRTSRLRRHAATAGHAHLAPLDLGDIVIAAGAARRQARDAGHAYAVELKVLALHGLLHLLGYDHHDPADGGRMARLERQLRAKGGLRAGLIERARSPEPRS